MSKKSIIILAAMILVILIGAGGLYAYFANNKLAAVNNSIPQQQSNTKNPGIQKVDLSKPPVNSIQSPQPIPKRELLPNEIVPTIFTTYSKDISQGFNLKTATTNFNFVPENRNEDLESNNGYIKLYINNVFNTRIYSSDYYLRLLKPGKYNVKVELSDSKGRSLSKDGKIIDSVVDIEVK
jgi:asparagine N-glycosylation enzyme membrane subunit Stt3